MKKLKTALSYLLGYVLVGGTSAMILILFLEK